MLSYPSLCITDMHSAVPLAVYRLEWFLFPRGKYFRANLMSFPPIKRFHQELDLGMVASLFTSYRH